MPIPEHEHKWMISKGVDENSEFYAICLYESEDGQEYCEAELDEDEVNRRLNIIKGMDKPG